jgi:hypothetical protein
MVKECPMDMKGLCTREDLNIIPLISYDFLIGMDWLEKTSLLVNLNASIKKTSIAQT